MTERPRLSVSITFDFDAMSVWIGSHNSNNPAMISRGSSERSPCRGSCPSSSVTT